MRLALPLLAAAAFAIYLWRSARRLQPPVAHASPASSTVQNDDADSLNAAEALKASHFAGAFAGLGTGPGAPEPRLRADSDADEVNTGLPDFMRGG